MCQFSNSGGIYGVKLPCLAKPAYGHACIGKCNKKLDRSLRVSTHATFRFKGHSKFDEPEEQGPEPQVLNTSSSFITMISNAFYFFDIIGSIIGLSFVLWFHKDHRYEYSRHDDCNVAYVTYDYFNDLKTAHCVESETDASSETSTDIYDTHIGEINDRVGNSVGVAIDKAVSDKGNVLDSEYLSAVDTHSFPNDSPFNNNDIARNVLIESGLANTIDYPLPMKPIVDKAKPFIDILEEVVAGGIKKDTDEMTLKKQSSVVIPDLLPTLKVEKEIIKHNTSLPMGPFGNGFAQARVCDDLLSNSSSSQLPLLRSVSDSGYINNGLGSDTIALIKEAAKRDGISINDTLPKVIGGGVFENASKVIPEGDETATPTVSAPFDTAVENTPCVSTRQATHDHSHAINTNNSLFKDLLANSFGKKFKRKIEPLPSSSTSSESTRSTRTPTENSNKETTCPGGPNWPKEGDVLKIRSISSSEGGLAPKGPT